MPRFKSINCPSCKKMKVPKKVNECLPCRRLYLKAYRARLGKEKVNEANRKYYAENKDAVREWRACYISSRKEIHLAQMRKSSRRFYWKNHDRERARVKAAYYAKHEETLARIRAYRRRYLADPKNREKVRLKQRAWYQRTLEHRRAWARADYIKKADQYRDYATNFRYGSLAGLARATLELEIALRPFKREIRSEKSKHRYQQQKGGINENVDC